MLVIYVECLIYSCFALVLFISYMENVTKSVILDVRT